MTKKPKDLMKEIETIILKSDKSLTKTDITTILKELGWHQGCFSQDFGIAIQSTLTNLRKSTDIGREKVTVNKREVWVYNNGIGEENGK